MRKYLPSIIAGLGATLALLLFYSLTMRFLAGSWYAAVSQFEKLWYFMIPLTIGFGIQVSLYFHLRTIMKNTASKNIMAANTTTSTIGMIACCAHHLTDVLPILGLSALSIFLVNFQTPILII